MKTPLEKWIIDKTGAKNRESLDRYRLGKIKEVINYAKENSLFYKEKLKDVDVDKINCLDDLEMIPFTYPKEVAEKSNRFLCVPQKYVKRIVTLKTSGTTNADGKRIYFTEEDLNMTVDFFYNGFQAMVNEDDRVMIMMPGETYGSVGDIIKKSLDRLNVKSYLYGILKDCDDAGAFIKNHNINSIVALPIQAMYLSKAKEDIFKKKIEKLMLSADYVPEVLIDRFKSKYNCKVFTHYGLTETGYGCAVECEHFNGYHIRENDIYLEIIDPLSGQVLEDGNLGEIVITTFNRQAMPFIRYRTGDYGRYKLKDCSCETFLKTLERSKGRISNAMFLINSYIHMSEFDEIIFQYDYVLDYKLKVSSDEVNIIMFLLDKCESIDKIKVSIQDMLSKKLRRPIKVKIILKGKENLSLSLNTMVKRSL